MLKRITAQISCLVILGLLAVTFLIPAAWGQAQAINGNIRGRVTDPSGAAVAGANVTITNTATGFTRSLTSGDDGYYQALNIPLGAYTVTVKKEGFNSVTAPNVVLEAGKEAVIDAALKVGQVETTVEVTGGAPVIEPTRTNIGRTITEAETQNLPLTSRNPYNFILFQPGVSGHPNPELGIPRTVNTNGAMDRINYQMDGMVDTQSDRYGLRLFPISDVYVREVQTVTNSFAPEFGNTSGDIYNVITNSGTNNIHGQFLWAHRWLGATAEPMLSKAGTPKTSLNDYAINSGGPAIKDKLFWFVGYEHLVRGVASDITITPANAAALGIPSSLLVPVPGKLHAQFFNIRGDWTINSKNQFFLRYNYFRNDFPKNTSSGGGISALDAWSDFGDRAHVVGAQLVSTLTPNVLNELRGGWAYRNNHHFPGAQTGPGPVVNISGKAIFNGTTAAGDRFNEKSPNWNDNLTVIKGTHSLKFGVAMTKYVDLQRNTSYVQYTFPTIPAYQAAQSGANPYAYTTFTSSQDPVGVHYSSLFWGLYGQDTWQATPNLVVTYGLRWDRYSPPDANRNAPFVYSRSFRVPNGNFAPRLGLAYRLNDKTVLRASAGVFYDAPPTNIWFNTLSQDGSNRTNNVSFTGCGAVVCPLGFNTAPVPAYPATGFGAATIPVQNVVTVTPKYKNAHTINASLQLSRELSAHDVVSLGYVFTGGRQLLFLRDMNLINPTGTLADGRPIYASCAGTTACSAAERLYPQFNGVTLQDVGSNSSYNALLLTYTHRFQYGLQVQANYTWSHAISDTPEANAFEQNQLVEDPANPFRDRGNSSIDRPHAFNASVVWEPTVHRENKVAEYLLSNNMFAWLFNISSGDAQNIVANKNLVNDPIGGSVQRPLFVGRNTARGPRISQIDLRYTRTFATIRDRFKPQFWLEANNLFNSRNVTSLKTTASVDAAGNITTPAPLTANSTVLESRIVQFGLQLRW